MRKLPSSLGALVTAAIGVVSAAAVCLAILTHSGFSPMVWEDLLRRSVAAVKLEDQADKLQSLVARLQQEREDARRLNARLSSRLQNLEGALDTVTDQAFIASSKKLRERAKGEAARTAIGAKSGTSREKGIQPEQQQQRHSQDELYRPAAYSVGRLTLDQRRTIRKVEGLVAKLKHLPYRSPVAYPIVTSSYGRRVSPNGIGSSFHHGIDLSLRTSSQIFATGAGTVEKVGFMHGYGPYIDLRHRSGITTRYAHLARSLVRPGQRVGSGQFIAQGGSSGTSTGRHLHYEVLVDGRSRDPMLFLKLPQKLEYALKNGNRPIG